MTSKSFYHEMSLVMEVTPVDRLLQLLETENWQGVQLFLLKDPHLFVTNELSCDTTLVACMELGMLAVRKAPEFLLPLLLSRLDLRRIFPSMIPEYQKNHIYHTPLLHHVCLDHKHEAIAVVLHSLGTKFAHTEATRCDAVCLELGDDKIRQDYQFIYTPMQTAWEATLLDQDFYQAVLNISSPHDLYAPKNTTLLHLWLTSLYLLMAMDGQPITNYGLTLAPTMSWSLIHAIARAGHLVHSTLMWVALQLYPDLIKIKEADGSSLLHLIAANSIYYRSRVPDHHPQQRLATTSTCLTDIVQTNIWHQSMLHMVLDKDRTLASSPDRNGRLPLHRLIVHFEQTTQQFEDLMKQHDGFDSQDGFSLNIQGSMDELLDAYPSAIEATDPKTGLCPFMLAASVNMPLDHVYHLLTRDPTLACISYNTLKRKEEKWTNSLQRSKKRILSNHWTL